jgi:N-acetylglucosaminyldiphosphoundecaprenol N-acetyl-beta-D-mannosaminyltransferase
MSSSYTLLGLRVDALTMSDFHACIAEAIGTGRRIILGSHNLHSAYLYQHDARLREFYALADYVRIDGMSLILIGHLLGLPLRRHHRLTYVDWLEPFFSLAARNGWRVFYLGSKRHVIEQAALVLHQRFPGLQLAVADGYFDPTPNSRENVAIVQKINAFQPDVLLVGMGMPRQQLWILENASRLHVNVISNSGAALDYVAGAVPTPPRWAARIGLEWLFRLKAEPRRLCRRYLWEPWTLTPLFIRELVAHSRKRSKILSM